MHTGQFTDLGQVIAFFERGGDGAGEYPGTNELVPLGLAAGEQTDLLAFLRTLAGPGPSPELLTAPQ
jgi:hypothetical protein